MQHCRLGPTVSSLEVQRATLRERQHEVTAALLRGEHPAGFAATGAAHTTRILLGKRAAEVAEGCPELTDLPHWRRHFTRYAATHPPQGCAHTQLSDFTRWMRSRSDIGRPERGWLDIADVHASRKRAAVTHLQGRRVILIGVGRQVRVIPLTARTRPITGG